MSVDTLAWTLLGIYPFVVLSAAVVIGKTIHRHDMSEAEQWQRARRVTGGGR